jgi:hypothetical protein
MIKKPRPLVAYERDQRSRLCESGSGWLIGHFERRLTDDLRDRARPDALRAGQDTLIRAVGSNANALQIRLELAGSDAGNLGTDAT